MKIMELKLHSTFLIIARAMKRSPLLISILLCIAGTVTAWACFTTPAEQIVPAKELIDRTKTIVLVQVVKAELLGQDTLDVRYFFREIQSLKGDAPETFYMDGVSVVYSNPLDHFEHHYDYGFWEDRGGRSWHNEACVINPSFAVGGIFLIFLEKPFHRKSFELIIRTHGGVGERDKWLSWVEEQIKTKTEQGAVE